MRTPSLKTFTLYVCAALLLLEIKSILLIVALLLHVLEVSGMNAMTVLNLFNYMKFNSRNQVLFLSNQKCSVLLMDSAGLFSSMFWISDT